MIGIIGNARRDSKSSFADLIAYCEKDGRAEYVGMQNIHFEESVAEEMESLAFQNSRCKDPLMHIILSWREMELPSNKQVDEAVGIALQELDLQDCQAVWFVHADTENRHVHIAVNRIDPETFKAIQPAGNWTHKAIQRAGRKIEITQGWEPEQHGSYFVTPEGTVVEKTGRERDTPKLSKPALDIEAHTAAKSAERICQEAAAPIIRSVQNWTELHEKLAEQGIGFERKGSGAILTVRDVVVKASKAGRDISLTKLESRLGPFQPRNAGIIFNERNSEPVDRVPERKVKTDWERYTAAREQYLKEKKEAVAALAERQKKEREELQRFQSEDRKQLLGVSWKGRGDLLNRQRSVMAASQKAAKLNMRDRHQQEQSELKSLYPPKFPNFKKWLELEASNESFISFRYPDNGTILGISLDGGRNNPVLSRDIRNFVPSVWNKGGVVYRGKGEAEAQFIDYGKKIVLARKCDETAVLAALQLANQKWGSAVINGTEEYKRQCVELAIRHNLKLANPELTKEVEEGRRRISELKGGGKMEKQSIFNQYADAVGAERFRVTVTEFTEGGTKAFIYDRQSGGYEGKTKEEILDAISKFSSYSHYHKNIIVTPMSPDKHHILVDDLSSEKLQQLKDDGYSPACVIESSPKNFQAVITVPSVEGDSGKDRTAANKLTRELNQKYGDPKLSGSVHGHRLPPFPNCKPKHRREGGTYPNTVLVEANGGFCEKARKELEITYSKMKEAEKKARLDVETRARMRNYATGSNDPHSAYWAHYRDIMSTRSGNPDYSSIDGKIGIRMRVTGYSANQIRSAIETNAPAMRRENMTQEEYDAKYRNRNWARYAAETTDGFVFGVRGMAQYERSREYRPRLMKVEGRDPREEARRERELQVERQRQEEKILGR